MKLSTGSLPLFALWAACAAPPKPHEFETFEQLRAQQQLEMARKRSPELMADSDALFTKAQEEWQSGHLDDSRRDALMGVIRLKTAFTLLEQDLSRARIAAAQTQIAVSDDELARVSKDLRATNDQIGLLQKLAEAKSSSASERQRMMQELQAQQQKLSEEQAKLSAREKLAAAELALKNVDTVDGANNAKVEYGSAQDMITRARSELGQGQYSAAQTSAEMARAKAEQAYTVAKPVFDSAAQNQSAQARAEALNHDAAGIASVKVRIERSGEVQRLVLPLQDAFVRRSTVLADGQEQRLDAIAQLVKKYPGYVIKVVGHTDSRGKHDQLVAISLARAQSVIGALVSRGVDARRLQPDGKGPDEPSSDNKSTTGRAQNNRVEVVFLIQ